MANTVPPQISMRALREALNLTLEDVVERIREQGITITRQGLNNAELGNRFASEALLDAWCRALGTKRLHARQEPELRAWLRTNGRVRCDELEHVA